MKDLLVVGTLAAVLLWFFTLDTGGREFTEDQLAARAASWQVPEDLHCDP